MNNEYEINISTLLLISNKNNTTIYDYDGKHSINLSTVKILDNNCKNYGSSLKGRKEGTEALTGIKYKTPIIVSELNKIIFFPTSSTRNDDCSWISLNNIKNYYKKGKNTLLIFNNGFEYEINVSYYVIENQILKSTLLESKLYKKEYKK